MPSARAARAHRSRAWIRHRRNGHRARGKRRQRRGQARAVREHRTDPCRRPHPSAAAHERRMNERVSLHGAPCRPPHHAAAPFHPATANRKAAPRPMAQALRQPRPTQEETPQEPTRPRRLAHWRPSHQDGAVLSSRAHLGPLRPSPESLDRSYMGISLRFCQVPTPRDWPNVARRVPAALVLRENAPTPSRSASR